MSTLKVSERFYSIQGEGQTIGKRAVFLRLTACNLLCKSDNWVCDTIEVWKKGKNIPFDEILEDYVSLLARGAHLVITGGEPLLQQDKIWEYLMWFEEKYNFLPVIEIETNGTIIPKEPLLKLVNYWNCSPKLENSGVKKEKRINVDALIAISKHKGSIFKFVVNRRKDIGAILVEFLPHIYNSQVYLMAAGATREELLETESIVAELSKEFNWNYSTRMHIHIWDKKTGV